MIVKATKTTTNVRNDSVLKDTDGERAWWQPIPGTHWILEPTMESVYWAENLKHRYFFLETPEHLKTGELRGL